MARIIDIRFIKYINLLEKVSKVRASHCFDYNTFIVFVVPSQMISKAVGENGKNVKQLVRILGKKIKIIAEPSGLADAEKFIADIVEPFIFKGLEITDTELLVACGGRQNKAALIGRDKCRLIELKGIVKDYFDKELRIV